MLAKTERASVFLVSRIFERALINESAASCWKRSRVGGPAAPKCPENGEQSEIDGPQGSLSPVTSIIRSG